MQYSVSIKYSNDLNDSVTGGDGDHSGPVVNPKGGGHYLNCFTLSEFSISMEC